MTSYGLAWSPVVEAIDDIRRPTWDASDLQLG
jgi:hypothetical protein